MQCQHSVMPVRIDPITARSRNMSRIRSRDTQPEMIVRRAVHALGYRFRLHDPNLPGTPDLVFKSRKKIIFVHGCFWHQHEGCKRATIPKSNTDYWIPKLKRNKDKDQVAWDSLTGNGWQVLIIWECELANPDRLKQRLSEFVSPLHPETR